MSATLGTPAPAPAPALAPAPAPALAPARAPALARAPGVALVLALALPFVLALVLAGCWTSAPAVEPQVPATPDPVARSCAIEPARTELALRVHKWIGRVGDRSWVLARRGPAAVLVALDGERLREVPLRGDADGYEAFTVLGTELWLAARQPAGRYELARVELAAVAPVEQRGVGAFDTARTGAAVAIGIGLSRVLVASSYPQIRMQLFDRASGQPIGPTARLPSMFTTPPEARCIGDDCFVVGLASGSKLLNATSRVFVTRFDARGGHVHAILANTTATRLVTHARGDRTVVAWSANDGVHTSVLDRRGTPRAPPARLAARAHGLELFGGPRQIALALQGRDRSWRVGVLDATATHLEDIQHPDFDGAHSLLGAVADDGLLVAGFSTSVDYHDGYHAWWARAEAAFLPARADAGPPIDVQPRTGGDGRGAMAAFPLVAPGHAAVLVAPVGFEAGETARLVRLRAPCTTAPR